MFHVVILKTQFEMHLFIILLVTNIDKIPELITYLYAKL